MNGMLPCDVLFRSTLPHGERLMPCCDITRSLTFRSTLPHGERPTDDIALADGARRFDPRSRTGSDSAISSN